MLRCSVGVKKLMQFDGNRQMITLSLSFYVLISLQAAHILHSHAFPVENTYIYKKKVIKSDSEIHFYLSQ